MSARYAIYYTPPADAALKRAAAAWLGRDAFTNASMQPPINAGLSPAEISYHTAAARRYGFHATLKAPFRLIEGESEKSLVRALDAFSANADPVPATRLIVGQLDGFFALLPEMRNPELDRLAGDVVTAFDHFRAPASEAEIERRNPDALDPPALRNLCQWGYPYIFDLFRFHMTLTGRVIPAERDRVRLALEEHFFEALSEPFEIASLALFVEPEPSAPFEVRSFHSLGRRIERKTG